jgi:hypothetical protein
MRPLPPDRVSTFCAAVTAIAVSLAENGAVKLTASATLDAVSQEFGWVAVGTTSGDRDEAERTLTAAREATQGWMNLTPPDVIVLGNEMDIVLGGEVSMLLVPTQA